MISSNMVETDVTAIYRAVLADASGEVYVVVPTAEGVEGLLDLLSERDDPPLVRVLAYEGTLKTVMGDFIAASTAAELIRRETLSLRTTDDTELSPLLVSEGTVVSVVEAETSVAGLATDEDEFVTNAREEYAAIWDRGEEYRLRTPAISRVRETLAAEIGQEVEADFARVLGSLETARGDGDGLDEVTISLLVAAKNEVLLYDVSKWGEDVGVASKATFSRTKTRLEDVGLIDTKKVPIDVGRPRLRLLLGDERLREASADELASAAQSLLSASAS